MKVRMFNDRLVPLTEQVNMWLSTLGPDVVIEHVLQSEAPGRDADETWAVTLTFLYSEAKSPSALSPTSAPRPELSVMVVCDPCGSIIKAQWVVREEDPGQAILCVEKCGCVLTD